MKPLLAAMREIAGLFVDDGSLALALIAWAVAAGSGLRHLPLPGAWGGPVLFLGCVAILAENLRRTVIAARPESSRKEDRLG